MIVTLGAAKGGVGKSTSAVYLAVGLARRGRTLIVDADPQASVLSWSREAAGFPAEVAPWSTRDLATRIHGVAGNYAHIVVDTGRAPGRDDPILRQALLASNVVIIPTPPSLMDVREIGRVLALIDEVALLHPLRVRILLTKVRAGTTAAGEARAGLADLPVMRCQIGLRESYSKSWGRTPRQLQEYTYLLEELMEEQQ